MKTKLKHNSLLKSQICTYNYKKLNKRHRADTNNNNNNTSYTLE